MKRIKNMRRFLICLLSFLFIGCSIAGGAVLLSNISVSDKTGGGNRHLTKRTMSLKTLLQMTTFGQTAETTQPLLREAVDRKMILIKLQLLRSWHT